MKAMIKLLGTLLLSVLPTDAAPSLDTEGRILKVDAFQHYIEDLNKGDSELYQGHVPNTGAWDFLKENIPLLDCPDEDIQRTYYFRWWTYRKHLKQTPSGFIVDEFLPNVSWAGKFNSISCAAGHHFYEGRWLHQPRFLDDYARFWFRGGGNPRGYSFWAADSIWARYLVTGRPVGRDVATATRTAGRRAFGIDPAATVILVVGGSQGARTLNLAAIEAFGDDPPFEVIHVAGPLQVDEARRLLDARSPGPHYRLVGWLDNLPEAIAAADLVISRSGGSVFELAAIGRPSILVPYPSATGDHQAKNARWLAEAGAAMVLPDHDCTGERLRGLVGALLADRRRLVAMAESARSVGRPEAAERVADEVIAIARGGTRRRLLPRLAGRLRRG